MVTGHSDCNNNVNHKYGILRTTLQQCGGASSILKHPFLVHRLSLNRSALSVFPFWLVNIALQHIAAAASAAAACTRAHCDNSSTWLPGGPRPLRATHWSGWVTDSSAAIRILRPQSSVSVVDKLATSAWSIHYFSCTVY